MEAKDYLEKTNGDALEAIIMIQEQNIRSKTEAESIRETAAAIPKDVRRIHQRHEFLRRRIILRHNHICMTRAMFVDVCNRLVFVADNLNGQNVVQIFRVPIRLRRRLHIDDCSRLFATEQLDVLFTQVVHQQR